MGASAGVQAIRYVNVGSFTLPSGANTYFDLLVTNQSAYAPYNSSENRLIGQFAQINLACNNAVIMRVTTIFSCATAPSCRLCDSGDANLRTSCYSAGCACLGATVYNWHDCQGAGWAAHERAYNCSALNAAVILPHGSLITMSVLDFDTGPNGDYMEQLIVPDYAYFRTPLRASSGASFHLSTIAVNTTARSFSSTARGDSWNNPTDPQAISDVAAVRGVQFFFRAQLGHADPPRQAP